MITHFVMRLWDGRFKPAGLDLKEGIKQKFKGSIKKR